ncbi:hypothetical protein BCV70DRAFT_202772 [Testicularia cyperi]|uniref:HTH APSES-type domain-containing protein n=1 Tax=Testicularia cyperi TaxID=1882483 RepID=A0A317XI75_9BASI|nr:hypothetical protein BCV70DRAFT_202772 [Testicularia cyperi]
MPAAARKSTPTPRKSTPRRARSSSVASNASTAPPASPSASARKTKKTSTAAAAAAAADKEKDEEESASVAATPSKKSASKKAASKRPSLPRKKNPRLKEVDEAVVKLQVIKREGHNIIIGRIKLPTVGGQDHAFLLKRFDTNAMAASSMFRLAFPYSDGTAEADEMQYLDATYDTNRANGGYVVEEVKVPETPKKRGRPRKNPETPKKDETDTESAAGEKQIRVLPTGSTGVRLQGTWIPAEDAATVAEDYGIAKFALPLIHATAELGENGGPPVLTSPAATTTSEVKTPRKRQRTAPAAAAAAAAAAGAAASASDVEASPKMVQKVTRVENPDGSLAQVNVETTIEAPASSANGAHATLSQADIDAQIAEAKALAAGIQKTAAAAAASRSPGSTRGQKRRALNDRPTAELDLLADDDEYADSGRVVRAFRRTTRVARKRPIATTAGVVAAAGAVGAGALAWISGGNADIAIQTLQNSLQNMGIENLGQLGQYGSQLGSQLASYLPW